jgi:hypothetical protein
MENYQRLISVTSDMNWRLWDDMSRRCGVGLEMTGCPFDSGEELFKAGNCGTFTYTDSNGFNSCPQYICCLVFCLLDYAKSTNLGSQWDQKSHVKPGKVLLILISSASCYFDREWYSPSATTPTCLHNQRQTDGGATVLWVLKFAVCGQAGRAAMSSEVVWADCHEAGPPGGLGRNLVFVTNTNNGRTVFFGWRFPSNLTVWLLGLWRRSLWGHWRAIMDLFRV